MTGPAEQVAGGHGQHEDDAAIRARFEAFLREEGQRSTSQRMEVFDRVFGTHEHFSAETLYGWIESDPDSSVSRATVYRTLDLLVKGGFIESFNTGLGEKVYEHVAGHGHHDHMVCEVCGAIEEFHDERIERLQAENAKRRGFRVHSHVLRLSGVCAACQRGTAPSE